MNDTQVSLHGSTVAVSWRDAIRLALRNWPSLFLLPSVVTAIATIVYMSLPTTPVVEATLQTSEQNLQLAINESGAQYVPGTKVVSRQVETGTFVVAATSTSADAALGAVQSIVERVPPNESFLFLLTEAQQLELRSGKQYLEVLKQRLAQRSNAEDVEPALIQAEIASVELRLRELEAFEVPVQTAPVIRAASISTARKPPVRNVTFFAFVATLFLSWMVIYGFESRRLNRLPIHP